MSETIQQSFLNRSRKDKFLLVFDIPPILKNIASKYVRDDEKIIPDTVQFSIWGTVAPGMTIKAVPARFAGDTLYVSSHSKDPYPPVNIKFLVDSGYDNYLTIHQWLNLLQDQKTGVYNQHLPVVDGNFNDYVTDLTLYGLDENNEKVISFKFTKAFPTSLDDLEYTEQATGEMELQCGFTFVFSQKHVEPMGGGRFSRTLD